MDQSKMWRVSLGDTAKALVSAVFAGAVMAGWTVISASFGSDNFDLFAVDWLELGKHTLNAAFLGGKDAFIGYIGLKFLSDDQKRLFGRIQLPV